MFFSSRAFDKLIKLLDIWAQSDDIVRPQQATDRVIDICDLIKLYPLNKRDRSNLSQYLMFGVNYSGRSCCLI